MTDIEFYTRYKYVRNASWQILIDLDIRKLPISAMAIARKIDASVLSYSEGYETLHSLGLQEQMEIACGFTVFTGKDCMIYYNDAMPMGRKRYTVLHEESHIFLNHISAPSDGVSMKVVCRYNNGDMNEHPRTIEEQQADMLAARILSPACALWGLGLHTWKEISAVCGLSEQAAKYRSERMTELYGRNMFLSHPLERKLYRQLYPWIQSLQPDAPTVNGIWGI